MSDETTTKVTLFTQDGCSPCFGVKAKLTKLGINFDVRNISNDPLALEIAQQAEIRSTPALLVGGTWYRSALVILEWAKQKAKAAAS